LTHGDQHGEANLRDADQLCSKIRNILERAVQRNQAASILLSSRSDTSIPAAAALNTRAFPI